MDYKPVRVSSAIRRKAAGMVTPGTDGPGPWVKVAGDIHARKWGHAPSAAPGSGTLEIVRFVHPACDIHTFVTTVKCGCAGRFR